MASTREIAAVLIVNTLVLGVSACGSDENAVPEASTSGGFPLTVSDCGREFTIEERPERIPR